MSSLITASNLLAAASSAFAAYFWFRSAQVKVPEKVLLGSAG
jgi:hypothetical protein